jgi:hypothetical protein
MTNRQLISSTKKLLTSKRLPLKHRLNHNDHKKTSSGHGVYALWDKDELLYVGHARTAKKAKTAEFSGIKNRLQSHWYGGGSLGLYLLVVKIAPTVGKSHWTRLANGEESIHKRTQTYVRDNLSYSFLECSTREASANLERWIHAKHSPLLNMLRKKNKMIEQPK